MIVIPSLSLSEPTVSSARPPRELLNDWDWMGFRRANLVEEERAGVLSTSRRILEELIHESQIEIQVAGNIKSADDVEALIRAGAVAVVLGPRALDEPDWLFSTVAQFPDQLIVSTTARERRIRSRGLSRTLPVDLRDLAAELADLPLAGLFVDFPSDSAIETVDLALVEDVVEEVDFPVSVGGGDPTLATLRDLEFRGVHATIISSLHLAAAFDEQTLARGFVD